jgi:hypothetical protein
MIGLCPVCCLYVCCVYVEIPSSLLVFFPSAFLWGGRARSFRVRRVYVCATPLNLVPYGREGEEGNKKYGDFNTLMLLLHLLTYLLTYLVSTSTNIHQRRPRRRLLSLTTVTALRLK